MGVKHVWNVFCTVINDNCNDDEQEADFLSVSTTAQAGPPFFQENDMSADNTVVVLSTQVSEGCQKREYRVAEMQAMENLTYEAVTPHYTNWIMAEVFDRSKVYEEEEAAWRAALALADEIRADGRILEYGVQSVELQRTFPTQSAAALRAVLKRKKLYPFDR
jgi:hypothetical protein